MNELISIIVPVFNAEQYIERCMESIKKQRYRDIEVILVDDGSIDNSALKCKKMCATDSRFRYISKENGGVSSARNYGIDYSTGNYITFIDSDDWIEEDFLKIMLDELNRNNSDIVMCARTVENGSETTICHFDDEYEVVTENTRDFIPSINHLYGAVWGALYKKESISDIRFDENISFGEDMLFILTAIKNSTSITRINKPMYHYWKDLKVESLSKGGFSIKKYSNIQAYKKAIELLENNNIAKEIMMGRCSDACGYFLVKYYDNEVFRKNFYKEVLCIYRKYFRYMKIAFKNSERKKIRDILLYCIPDIVLPLYAFKMKKE